jgi:hypothetical protein
MRLVLIEVLDLKQGPHIKVSISSIGADGKTSGILIIL